MKKISILFAAAIISLSSFKAIQSYNSDAAHSRLGFEITHLGISDISGNFKKFEASIQADKPDFSDAVVTLTADAASIDTDVEMRDNHLRSADFFDVEKYPSLSFKSTGIKPAGKNKYKLSGNLTMHGITKPVTMDLKFNGTVENPMNKTATSGFQVTGTIKRSDFGIGAGFPEAVISDVVRIQADGEFTPKK